MVDAVGNILKRSWHKFDSRIYILSLGWLISSAGFAVVIPYISIYLHDRLGLSMTQVGVFFLVMAVFRSIPQPFTGMTSDRFGRVSVMGWTQVLRCLTFAGVSYVIWEGLGFWPLAAVISFNWLFGAFLHPTANAMVADLVPRQDRIQAYALLRIAGNVGWAAGPLVGGFLADVSYALLFLVSASFTLLSGLLFLVILKEPSRRRNAGERRFDLHSLIPTAKDKLLYTHCLISFLLFLAVAQLIAALSVYSVDTIGISQSQLGQLYFINGAMVVLLQYPVSGLFKRMRLTRQLATGAMIHALGYLSVGFSSDFHHLALCMVIITTGEMIVSPPVVTMVANLSSPEQYGRNMGLFGFFQMGGWSIGPFIGGSLLDLFASNQTLMWVCIFGMAVAAAGLYLVLERFVSDELNDSTKPRRSPVPHVAE
jgi:MFS family permease